MKNIFLFLSFSALLFFSELNAAPVDTSVARQAAIAFCQRNGNFSADPQLAYVHTIDGQDNGSPAFYVYNLGNRFVIISADDAAEPVLGYSDKGCFSPDRMPGNMRAFLNGYAREIKVLRDHNAPSKWQHAFVSQPKDTVTGVIVGPLLTSRWAQGTLYNDLCPADPAGPNGHAYTGCAATAMAQIIRYWEYPTVGNGEHGYDHDFGGSYGHYGYQYANFGNTTYDYAHMPDELDENSTPEEVEAVATLMYHCGVSINMMYGPHGSAAIGVMTAKALRNYFRYPSDVRSVMRSNYTDQEWRELIKHELDEHAPVFYGGNDSVVGGHAFVCDGYSDDDFYHFDWGWAGDYNGYFRLELLNPSVYAFITGQHININVRPVPVGVADNPTPFMTIYPNPAHDIITIQHSPMMNRIQIYDVFGKLLQSEKVDGLSTILNISSLSPGTYILRIFDDQNVSVRKFIKR